MRDILDLQHAPVEHPGTFGDFLHADGPSWTTVVFDAGGAIPEAGVFDLMLELTMLVRTASAGVVSVVCQREHHTW